VLEAIPGSHFRLLIRLVLVLLGLFALAGRSDASDCHAPERPTFGMDPDPIAPSLTATDPLHYRSMPCPGEPAGLPSKIQAPQASVSTGFLPNLSIASEPRPIEPSDLRRPLADSRPPERPPRDLPSD
jgi:hypothetical protein